MIVTGISVMFLSCNKTVDYLATANFWYVNKTTETIKLELYQASSAQLLKTSVIGVNDSLFLSYRDEGGVAHPFNELPVDSARIIYGNKKAQTFTCRDITDTTCNEPRNILRLPGNYQYQPVDELTTNHFYTFSIEDYAAADSLK